jgi:hypothetical protein
MVDKISSRKRVSCFSIGVNPGQLTIRNSSTRDFYSAGSSEFSGFLSKIAALPENLMDRDFNFFYH